LSGSGRTADSAIEGVAVLGMHRSGTSVATRLASLVGLALCQPDDLLAGFAGNPRGHWESKSLVSLNNRLLAELDGSWFSPPALEREEVSLLLDRHASRALAVLRLAHPRRPFVWKDPRTCLLMPFWSKVLAHRTAYVMVARHPSEVSESLERRNGFAPSYSLALWERYTRLGLAGCAGAPTMLCTYDEVLADPVAWCEQLVTFLRDVGLELPAVDGTPISAFVAGDLRRGRRSWQELEPAELFPPQRRALIEAATRTGTYASYDPPQLPAESPATNAVLREVRESVAGTRPFAARLGALPSRFTRRAPPARDPRPAASVIFVNKTEDLGASISALSRVLPAGGEVFVPAGTKIDRAQLAQCEIAVHELGVAEWPASQPQSASAMLAAGVEASRGRLVLLSTGEIVAGVSWYADVEKALAQLGAGAIGATLRLDRDPDTTYIASAFVDADLRRRFVAGRAAGSPMAIPLLAGGPCAFSRRVLVAAGGVDGSFDTASAALAELSLRLWRMRFRSYAISGLEVWVRPQALVEADDGDGDGDGLYDRLRIATLHLDGAQLRSFIKRAERHPSYAAASARLAATDVRARRALIDAVCAFETERYFDEFPLRRSGLRTRWRRARRLAGTHTRRWRLLRLLGPAFSRAPYR
jgi:hypothetical protein